MFLCLAEGLYRDTLLLRYPGGRLNPVEKAADGAEEITERMLQTMGLSPIWRYRGGWNQILFRLPERKNLQEFLVLGSLILTLLAGVLTEAIPPGVRQGVIDYCLNYISTVYIRFLHTFAGLLIFLSVSTGVCAIGTVGNLNRVGRLMFSRYLSKTVLLGWLGMALILPFFSLRWGAGASGENQALTLLDMVADTLPSDPISPFFTGNILQIIFLALTVGVAMLFLGERSAGLLEAMNQANAVVIECIKFSCRLIPLYIFSSLTTQFWTGGMGSILQMWKPVALTAAVYVLLLGSKFLLLFLRTRVPGGLFIRKILPAFLVALSTASTAASFAMDADINETQLGIDKGYNRLALPVGNMLYQVQAVLVYAATALYLAEQFGVQVNFSWVAMTAVTCLALSLATPPIAGSAVICLGVLLRQTGIPEEGIAMAVPFLMLIDFLATAEKCANLHMEMELQAHKLGMLDHNALMKRSKQ